MRLAPGTYRVRAFIPGEQLAVSRGVMLEAGATAVIDTDRLAGFAGVLTNPPACACRGFDGYPTWFSLHQHDDGRWSASEFEEHCESPCGGAADGFDDVETTGLVLLCYLGAGETHHSGGARDQVARALRYLKRSQAADGTFAEDPKSVRANAVATLAMSEAYGLTGSRLFKQEATRGVAALFAARTPGQGWKRHADDAAVDIETTTWAAMALRSALMAEITFPDEFSWAEVTRCVRSFGDPAWHPPAECAALCVARIMAGADPTEVGVLRSAVEQLAAEPSALHHDDFDPQAVYFGSVATYAVGGKPWKSWNRALKTGVIDHQRFPPDDDEAADGHHPCGSWDPRSPAAAVQGRPRTTALANLTLDIYYRYGRVFGASSR